MPSNRAPSGRPAPNSAQLVHTPTYFHISGHNSSAGPAPHQKYAVSTIYPQHHHLLHHNHHHHRPPRTTAQDSALADQSILPWSICLAMWWQAYWGLESVCGSTTLATVIARRTTIKTLAQHITTTVPSNVKPNGSILVM